MTPAYLRAVRTLVLNEMYGKLEQADANETWVRQASSDPDCSHEAIKKILDLRFGEKRAAYDPSDPESNKTWVSKGGTVVYGSMMNAQEWKKAKEAAPSILLASSARHRSRTATTPTPMPPRSSQNRSGPRA